MRRASVTSRSCPRGRLVPDLGPAKVVWSERISAKREVMSSKWPMHPARRALRPHGIGSLVTSDPLGLHRGHVWIEILLSRTSMHRGRSRSHDEAATRCGLSPCKKRVGLLYGWAGPQADEYVARLTEHRDGIAASEL